MAYLILSPRQGCVSGNYGNHQYWGIRKTYSIWNLGVRELRMYTCDGNSATDPARYSILGSNAPLALDNDDQTEATLSYNSGRLTYDFGYGVEVNRFEYIEGINASGSNLELIYSDDGVIWTQAALLQSPRSPHWVKYDAGVDTEWVPFTP